MIRVAVLGYGTIGSGVVEVLRTNSQVIAQKVGEEITVKYVLDLREFPGSPIEDILVHDFSRIADDPEVDIVVETMGGLKPAYDFVKACLLAGKHVATSNKALVAAHGTELLSIAREKSVSFLFEASVGGGIPIIRPLYHSLAGEMIQEITGILNGTTNYILTKMDKEGESFDSALKQAQDLGYAESNPEADVEGHDSCRKIAILTAVATGREVDYKEIHTEGITRITDVDFKYAEKMKTSVKLFASSRVSYGRIHAWVAPVMIDSSHPLYAVSDVYNGVLVKGNMIGTVMFYGSGAGKLPTASAVVADIVDAAKNRRSTVYSGWIEERLELADMSGSCHRYFVRFAGKSNEVLAEIEAAFGQVELVELDGMDEFAVLTKKMSEGSFQELSDVLDTGLKAGGFKGILQVIRAELQ